MLYKKKKRSFVRMSIEEEKLTSACREAECVFTDRELPSRAVLFLSLSSINLRELAFVMETLWDPVFYGNSPAILAVQASLKIPFS